MQFVVQIAVSPTGGAARTRGRFSYLLHLCILSRCSLASRVFVSPLGDAQAKPTSTVEYLNDKIVKQGSKLHAPDINFK